jgi:hypothetical protein
VTGSGGISQNKLPKLIQRGAKFWWLFFVALVMCEPATFAKTAHILGVVLWAIEQDLCHE